LTLVTIQKPCLYPGELNDWQLVNTKILRDFLVLYNKIRTGHVNIKLIANFNTYITKCKLLWSLLIIIPSWNTMSVSSWSYSICMYRLYFIPQSEILLKLALNTNQSYHSRILAIIFLWPSGVVIRSSIKWRRNFS
jgi:hypothetical protein